MLSTQDKTRIDDTRIASVRPLMTPALLEEPEEVDPLLAPGAEADLDGLCGALSDHTVDEAHDTALLAAVAARSHTAGCSGGSFCGGRRLPGSAPRSSQAAPRRPR